MTYSVTYDLMKPGQGYGRLIDRLRQLNATEVQRSQWLLVSHRSAEQIRDDLIKLIDANDRLLVAGLTGEAAWHNLLQPVHVMQRVLVS